MAERTFPYRIAIHGVGDVGCIVIREAARLPEFEIAGAFVYSENKDGVDVGVLAGITPLGVCATHDWSRFLEVDCDVVVHTTLDAPFTNAQEDFVKLLEAGKNVLTSHPYSYLPARDPSFGKAIKAACERGKATFCAGGLNPDFMTQRLTPLLTGLSNDVSRIKLEEYFDCEEQQNASILHVIGLGGDPSQALDENGSAIWYQKHYNYQMIQHIGYELGVDITRLAGTSECIAAPDDIKRSNMTIKRGQTGLISYESTGYVDDKPFMSIKITYYFSPIMKPACVGAETEYVITIEGRPSSRTVVNLKASYLTCLKHVEGEPAAPGYHSFGVTLLQAVPMVAEAPPGFKSPDVPPVHWKKDQRKSVGSWYRET